MTYSLTFCAPLSIFRLDCLTTASCCPKTEIELRAEFTGNPILNRWVDFAKENAGKDCVYDVCEIGAAVAAIKKASP
jgi:hypothetical protein